MSYKYSRGNQIIGDLSGSDDPHRNTGIDFEDDEINLVTSGSIRLQANNDGVYIPDSPQGASLFVSGGIQLEPGNQEGIRFANKGNNELNFISFQEGSEGGSSNARLGYNSEEYIFIAPGRAADFFINSGKSGGNFTFPFSIMDDGTAKFQKGLEDSAVRSADVASDIAFYVSGTTDGNNNAVFVGNVVMSGGLNMQGDLEVAQYIKHDGDGNTLINFADDKIILKAGGKAMITMEEKGSAPHEVTINDGGNNIDFVVKGNGSNAGNPAFKVDASNNRVGINGVGSPIAELDVAGKIAITAESSTPSQPSDGQGYLYTKTDGKIYWRSHDVSETDLTSGGASATPALMVHLASTFTYNSSGTNEMQTIPFNNVLKNTFAGGAFNTGTYTFTAPEDGFYYINVGAYQQNMNSPTQYQLWISSSCDYAQNHGGIAFVNYIPAGSSEISDKMHRLDRVAHLSGSDEVKITFRNIGAAESGTTFHSGLHLTYLTIHKL